jgi:dethiobiotin synthetase
MTALQLPLLLVTGSYLGSISHTLTALHALHQSKLHIAAIVISESAHSSVTVEDTMHSIARFAQGVPLVALPRLPESAVLGHATFAEIDRLLDAASSP